MAFCTYCGKEISDAARVCPQCGHPTAAVRPATDRRQEPLAVASLVLAIAGFVVCPIVCSVIALVLGYQARTKLRSDPSLEGEGLAKAGVILGWIGIGVGVLLVIGALAAIFSGVPNVDIDVPTDINALRRP
jgi:hypothetical protein